MVVANVSCNLNLELILEHKAIKVLCVVGVQACLAPALMYFLVNSVPEIVLCLYHIMILVKLAASDIFLLACTPFMANFNLARRGTLSAWCVK